MRYNHSITEKFFFLLCFICLSGFARLSKNSQAVIGKSKDSLHITWEHNKLTIWGDNLRGKKINIEYLEAFCKTGSTNRLWDETKIPHETRLVSTDDNNQHITLKTIVQPDIEIKHDIRARKDEVEFNLVVRNKGDKNIDIDW